MSSLASRSSARQRFARLRIKGAGLVIAGLLFGCLLSGQSITMDAGGPGDTGFSAGTTAYTIPSPLPLPIVPPGTNDLTLRYAPQFTYTFTVPQPGPYTVVLYFVEPTVTAPGQRIFSVTANDQPIVQNLDLVAEAGYLVPTARAAIVFVPGTKLALTFSSSVRNAVVSMIQVIGGTGAATLTMLEQCTVEPKCVGLYWAQVIIQGVSQAFYLVPAPNPPLNALVWTKVAFDRFSPIVNLIQ